MKKIIFICLLTLPLGMRAHEVVIPDSIVLDEVEITHPKENASLKVQSVSATEVGREDMENQHLTSLKQVSSEVANVFIPDYGSRLTSAVYIRGIGSRINTPAVGLYVDNIPYIDKSAFDFSLYDIEKVEILRGPQATLYGRNTMGGLIRVTTKKPFRYQGTDIHLGYATQDSHRNIAISHYNRVNNQFALSVGVNYEGGDGFFRNSTTGNRVDCIKAGSERLRLLFFPTSNLKMDFNISYDYSDEGAYPYYYEGSISANHQGNYRRGMMNSGLNIEYKMRKMTLTSTTGFQHLDDRMFMDQDFTSHNLFTLEQQQNSNVFSQEFILRNSNSSQRPVYNWLFGAGTFWQGLTTNGPVTFYDEGISSLIEDNVNNIFRNIKQQNPKMPDMMLSVSDREFVIRNDMKTPLWSGALFHESTLDFGALKVSGGIRMEYEKTSLDFGSGTDINYEFQIPMMKRVFPLEVSPLLSGRLDKDYVQLLPKLSVSYSPISRSTDDFSFVTYATVSKGYRSGGYNIQMFSDLISGEMKNEMIDQINTVSGGMMERFVDLNAIKSVINTSSVEYKPEYSWNYEIGAKYNAQAFSLEAAAFFIDTHDQQISRFSQNGLGRMMVNAGRSSSCGAELSLSSQLSALSSKLSYGFTHATFRSYDDGEHNYKDNYVPFVPMHTLSLMTEWKACKMISLGAELNGAGRIYWTEANNEYQNFYCTLSAHAVARINDTVTLTLWGKNLTQTRYNTFCFESMNRTFVQHCRPLQIGLDLKLHF